MAKDPAFLFYPNDFMSGTQFFSDEQVGKYMRLLMAQHQHGHLPENHMKIICKSYDKDIFSKFIQDSEGLWYNERLEIEIIKRKRYTESRGKNRENKTNKKIISISYDNHMENRNINSINNILKEQKNESIIIGPKSKFQIAIKPVYIHEKPIVIFDLQEYFTQTAQIHALKEKGWDKFKEFLEANPGRVFNDQEHVYNAFKSFCLVYIPPEKKVAYNAFNEAEYNKSLWTLEAWEKRYERELKSNQEFIKHFGYEKL